MEPAPFLPRWPGIQVTDAVLNQAVWRFMLNSEVGWGSGRTRKAVKRRQRRTMASVVSPVEILRRTTGGMAKGRPQRPASAFVFLNGGDSGVINISSVTWDCFLADAAERNMKWASDGHQAILAPRGPFTAFKSCFYSSSRLFFPGTFFFFLSPKAALMHFIPGSLWLWWSSRRDGKGKTTNLAALMHPGVCFQMMQVLFLRMEFLISSQGVVLTFLAANKSRSPTVFLSSTPCSAAAEYPPDAFASKLCCYTTSLLLQSNTPNNLVSFLHFMILNPVLRRSLLHFC